MPETTIGNAYLEILPKASGDFGTKLDVAVGNVMANVAAKAASAVSGFVNDTINAGMGFDTAMSQVAATMGGTVADMEKEIVTVGDFTGNLTDFAKKMGAETAFSATQSAEALNYMALAGYDAETSMKMLPNVLDLAASGSMDLARASDMVTDTQTAFGISLERTSQMVDEMAKAASTGNTSVEQLGDAFLTVGGLAQELNGGVVQLSDGTTASVDGVQELEIALTAMANAGVKGTEAGTHMRNMLLKLSSPTSEGAKQLEALGVEVFDAEGKMRSLSGVFGDLDSALGTLTQEEKIQAISDLFNTRDLASAEALLNAVGEDWDAIGESILDAQGAASLMAATQLDNLEGDVTMFQSALEGLQIALFDKVEPALRGFVGLSKDVVGWLHDALDSDMFNGVLDAISGKFQSAFEAIRGVVEALWPSIQRIIGILGVLKSLLADSLMSVLSAFGEGLSISLGNPLDAVSGVVDGVLLPALQKVIDFLVGTVTPFVKKASTFIAEEIVPRIIDLGTVVANVLGAAFETVSTIVGEVVLPVFESIAGFILENVVPVIGTLIAWALDHLIPALGNVASFITGNVVPAISNLASWIGEHLQPVFEEAKNFVLEHVVPAFRQMGDFIVNTVVPDIQALAGWVGEHLSPIFEGLKDTLLNHAVPALQDMAVFVMDNVVPAVQAMYGWFKDNILPVLEDVAEFITDEVAPALKDIADRVLDHVVPAFAALFDWVNGNIIPVFEALAGILATVVGWLIDVARNIGGAIEGAAAFFFGGGSSPDVEWHAVGGIVNEATLIGAGERGAELIWPSYEPYLSKYADAIASRTGGGVTIEVGELVVREEADVDRIAEKLYQKAQRANKASLVA